MTFTSTNPATGETVARYDGHGPDQVERDLTAAAEAARELRAMTVTDRAGPMTRLARLLRDDRERLASVVTAEMGKPVREARAEVDKCAWVCEHYAEAAEGLLRTESIPTEHSRSEVRYRPLGVILAVMPWNFPFWQVLRAAAPTVMAGNSVLLKHAPNVSGCALAIQELVAAAGFPDGTLRVLLVDPPLDAIIADPRVRGVTLTGSERAGAAVGRSAGASLKKCVLELGGSDPFVIAEDADLDAAVATAVRARFQNTGQSCIAAKRFLIVESVADEFEERVVAAVRALRMGDPRAEDTDLGPMARPDLRDTLVDHLRATVEQGGRVLTGGGVPEGPGAFVEPTVLADVRRGTPAFTEETFGPLAALTRVPSLEAAIEAANDSRFGLSAAVWTADTDRALALADRLDTGGVFVNGMTASDPRLPFGGVKRSGHGRELGAAGIHEFTNVRTVVVS